MAPTTDPAVLRSSLAAYLEELRESGIEDLPADLLYDAQHGVAHTAPPKNIQQGPAPAKTSVEGTTHHETLEQIRKNLGDCKRCKLGSLRYGRLGSLRYGGSG